MQVAKDYVGHSYTVKELRRARMRMRQGYVNIVPGDVVYIIQDAAGGPRFSLSREYKDWFTFDKLNYFYTAPRNEQEFMQVYGLQPLALQKARDLFAN